LQGSDENGSPLCPDCRKADEVVVKMDLVEANAPPTRPAD
jgi:hypothetical protein